MRNFNKSHARKIKVLKRRHEKVNYISRKLCELKGHINYDAFVKLLKQFKEFEDGNGSSSSMTGHFGGYSSREGAGKPCKIIKFPGTNKERSLAARAKYGSKRRDRYMKRVA